MPSSGYNLGPPFGPQSGPLSTGALDTAFALPQSVLNSLLTFSNFFVDSSGAANSITVTVPSPLLVSYVAGLQLQVQIANANVSSVVTMNVNGMGSRPVINSDGTALGVGQIVANGIVDVVYDGTSFQILGQTGVFTGAINLSNSSQLQWGGNANNAISGTTVDNSVSIFAASVGVAKFKSTSIQFPDDTLLQWGGAGNAISGSAALNRLSFFAAATGIAVFNGSAPHVVLGVGASANSIRLNSLTAATIGAAGGASALPATPLGYLTVSVNGTNVKIPYYNP